MKSRYFAPLLLLTLFVSTGFATDVYVNDPIVTGITPVANSTVFGAAYLINNGGDDQLLGLTESSGEMSRQVGNTSALDTETWDFQLEHRAGEGIIFTLSSVLVQHIIGWGTFAPPLSPACAPTCLTVNNLLPIPGPYNSIDLKVTTTVSGANNGVVDVKDLAFSGTTLTLSSGSAFTDMSGGPAASSSTQRILFDGDLSQEDWTLTGTVAIDKSGNGCPNCAIFAVTGSSVTAEFPPTGTEVPEPASFAFAAGGLVLLALGSLRRRR